MTTIKFYSSIGSGFVDVDITNKTLSTVTIEGIRHYCISSESISSEITFVEMASLRNVSFFNCNLIAGIEVSYANTKAIADIKRAALGL